MADPGTTMDAALDEVAAVADAVLFEGYLLYPYRASAQKNQIRWQWGVLMPDGHGADTGETSANRTECLLEPRRGRTRLHVRVRFLQLQQRTVLDRDGAEVAELDVDGTRYVRWEEGLPRQVDAELTLGEVLAGASVPIEIAASREVEDLTGADGAPAGRVVRTCEPLTGTVRLEATEIPGPYDVLRLRVDVRNDGTAAPAADRDGALHRALIGAHTLLAVEPGSFLSPTDPPRWAEPFVAECVSEHSWPVLAGPPERSDLLLSAPIILSDHQQLAPESTVNLFDGLENDEILTLRTMVLTDAEKAEARATDPRAAAIVDAVDALPPELLERLHGAVRSMGPAGGAHTAAGLGLPEPGVPTFTTPSGTSPSATLSAPVGADDPMARPPDSVPWWDPAADSSVDPESDSVLVGDVPVARGSTVVLRPGAHRRSDAQDAFLAGMRATVHAVVHDVDGTVHVAVTVDDDPATELQLAHGRFRYFRPDELEPAR